VPEKDWQTDPLEQIRARISVLNTRILTTISITLAKGESFTENSDFLKALDQINLYNGEKEFL